VHVEMEPQKCLPEGVDNQSDKRFSRWSSP